MCGAIGEPIPTETDGTDIVAFMRSELPGLIADEFERRKKERAELAFQQALEAFQTADYRPSYDIQYFGPPERSWRNFWGIFNTGE